MEPQAHGLSDQIIKVIPNNAAQYAAPHLLRAAFPERSTPDLAGQSGLTRTRKPGSSHQS